MPAIVGRSRGSELVGGDDDADEGGDGAVPKMDDGEADDTLP
jgi:hypothetical protein